MTIEEALEWMRSRPADMPESKKNDIPAIGIIEIVQRSGVPLTKTGKDRLWKGCCPFHKEITPSFTVDTKTQTFTCFGCGRSGTAAEYWSWFNSPHS